MGNHELVDPPERSEALRERSGVPSTVQRLLPAAAPRTDGNETITTMGPFLAALLRALSAWAT